MTIQINLEDRHLMILGAIILAAVAMRLAIGATGTSQLDPGHPLSQTWIDTDLNMSNYSILTTGKVGIGTASPGYKLHVIGDVYANGGWLRTSGNAGWYSESYGGGWYMSDTGWLRTYNSKSVWTDTGLLGSNGGLTVGYGGASPPSNGAIIAGNVGIGVNTAARKLHVAGNGISISNDATDRSSIYWDTANSRLVIKVS